MTMNQYDEFEPDNLSKAVTEKLVAHLEDFRGRIKKIAPKFSIKPQNIPPSKIEGLQIDELAQLAQKYGHRPELGFACPCPICRSVQKLSKRSE